MSTLTTLVPVLDGNNYNIWSKQMEAFLKSSALWEIVCGRHPAPAAADEDKPTDAETEAFNVWATEDDRAVGSIVLRLSPAIQRQVEKFGTSRTIWDHLKTQYGGVSAANVYQDFK